MDSAASFGFSEGRRLLLAVLQEQTQDQVAARVSQHVPRTRQAVSGWQNGAAPDYRSRRALEAEYQIPMGSWDEAAKVPEPRASEPHLLPHLAAGDGGSRPPPASAAA